MARILRPGANADQATAWEDEHGNPDDDRDYEEAWERRHLADETDEARE